MGGGHGARSAGTNPAPAPRSGRSPAGSAAGHHERAHLLATFPSGAEAAEAARRHAGIVVGCTAVLPRLPKGEDESWWDLEDERERYPLIAELEAEGADVHLDEEGGGYLLYVDIRATAPDEARALAIGRRLLFGNYPVGRLKLPWAPGVVLLEEEIRARLYVAALLQDASTPPEDDIERAVAAAAPDLRNGIVVDRPALAALLGVEEPTLGADRESGWFAHREVRVEGADVLIGQIWFLEVPLGFPALVGWLQHEGVSQARYDIWNLMRP